MFVGGGILVGVTTNNNMKVRNRRDLTMWSRSRNGDLSRDGLFRSRYFRILSNLWETEPQPIKACLREIREEETSCIKWVRGYCGAWKAEKIQTINQWRKK